MFHVYVLKSVKFDKLYIGITDNIRRRVLEHNSGVSKSTKKYTPWRLVYYETYLSEKDARNR